MTEKDLQKQAEKYLRDKGIRYFHYQKYSNHRYDTNPAFKGFPDMIVFLNKYLLVVEFKMIGKKLSTDQEAWKRDIEDIKYIVYQVIYDMETFKIILDDIMTL